MEERERQAREGAGGRAFGRARWLLLAGVSAALLAGAVVAGASDGRARVTTRTADAVVTARANNVFDPSTVTITQGERVTWTNSGGGDHNVAFDDGSFTEPSSPSTANWTTNPRTFNSAGSFTYHCQAHPFMTGRVNVNAATPAPGPPPPPPPPPPGGGTPQPGGGNPAPGGGGGGGGGGADPGGGGGGGSPGGRADTSVTLRVSDASPTRGARVRFFGTVAPEQDGRMLQLQRRSRGGSYSTVARIRLTDAGSARSKFSKRFRVLGDAVFRARLPADSAHELGVSRTRRLDVP
jgi:plastocyanin